MSQPTFISSRIGRYVMNRHITSAGLGELKIAGNLFESVRRNGRGRAPGKDNKALTVRSSLTCALRNQNEDRASARHLFVVVATLRAAFSQKRRLRILRVKSGHGGTAAPAQAKLLLPH